MLKTILLLIVFLGGLAHLQAQNLKTLSQAGKTDNGFELTESTKSQVKLSFQLNSYWMEKVNTPNGVEKIINAMESSRMLEKGAPHLPKFSTSLIIPEKGKMELKVNGSKYVEIEDVDIAPSKGNLTRDVNPADVPYTYGKVYEKDAFFPGKLGQLNKPYIARNFRGEALWLYPFQYNPVSRTLRIYTELEITVHATSEKGENELTKTATAHKVTPEFHEIYKKRYINYDASKYDPVGELGNLLIICHDDWTGEMQDYVDWKTTIGRETEMVTVTEAGGTASDIAAYVEDYYNNNDLAYLLLVGDAEQVPTNSGSNLGGDSDNAYAYIEGDDHYLEFFVGRFSAETAADVETQVSRTITYEKGTDLPTGWLNRTMGVTSQEGTGDDDEYDYEHYRNLATDLLEFTYTESLELFEGSQGGNDASGDPSASDVANDINDGVGIINYTGHGSQTTWVTSGFSNTDINNSLTNANMLPFIWSVACVNGDFVGATCFGEAWVRATDNGNPTGAIAINAATINQSWAPPMAAQDEMVDILTESYETNIKRTFAGLATNGCHLMNDEYQDYDMTDTWTNFGDPSLYVRTDDPTAMTVTYNDVLLIGQESFTVNCDQEDAIVSLTNNGEIMGTEVVVDGTATINFEPPTEPGMMTVAVTGFNKSTHIDSVEITPADEPYVVLNSVNIADSVSGNGNGQADYNEEVNIDIVLENVAEEGSGYDASDLDITLTTEDSLVNITTANTSSDSIIAGAIDSIPGAFAIALNDDIPDQHSIKCDLEISATGKTNYTWNTSFTIKANAPALTIIDDMVLANDDDDNGRLDPGETADLTFAVINSGHADASAIMNSLNGNSPYLSIAEHNFETDIATQDTVEVTYSLTASTGTPPGTIVDMTFNTSHIQAADEFTKELVIGQAPEIEVGEGTEESGNYPFYSYYKANRSQMLYKGSEIGAGEMNIQELAFDFTQCDPEITELSNFRIKIIETSEEEFGDAYADTTDATVVLDSASYTMPQTTGWHTFDIENYTFDAANNLIIEITWGINEAYGSWGDHYKLNSSNTSFNSVAFGYADTEALPAYSANATTRPNLKLFFEGETMGELYTATFNVTDGTNSLTNATVAVGEQTKMVDTTGQVQFSLYSGSYHYSAEADGYGTVSNVAFTIDSADFTETIILTEEETYMVNFTVMSGDEYIEGATITCPSGTATTDENGEAGMEMVTGNHEITVTKEGYADYNETIEVDGIENITINLVGMEQMSNIDFNLYPNPNNGNFHLQADGQYTVTVMNTIGNVVHQQQINNEATIDLSNAASGVYFIKIEDENAVETKRFIINR